MDFIDETTETSEVLALCPKSQSWEDGAQPGISTPEAELLTNTDICIKKQGSIV